jgi:serine/threonine protein kinase
MTPKLHKSLKQAGNLTGARAVANPKLAFGAGAKTNTRQGSMKGPGEPKEPGDVCLNGLYTILKSVGKGSFGDIWLVKHTVNGSEPLVLKEVALNGISEKEQKAAKVSSRL